VRASTVKRTLPIVLILFSIATAPRKLTYRKIFIDYRLKIITAVGLKIVV